jgi:hypothetical protein
LLWSKYPIPYARQLARGMRDDVEEMLLRAARDYNDIAKDLERGAIEIRRPELMPQNYHH